MSARAPSTRRDGAAPASPTRRIALVGCGAIGTAVVELLRDDPAVRVAQVVVPPRSIDAARARLAPLAPQARVVDRIDLVEDRPDLVVECAGHAAVAEHVLPALRRGVPAIVASIGALHDAATLVALEAAARDGGASATLVAGAFGGIDALAAARLGGLDHVAYTGRKPPAGWRGTPAERLVDLDALAEAAVIFDGSAREAAKLYPKNANVAALVSLAGVGLERTRATLVADPAAAGNVHHVVAEGAFGRMELTLAGRPLASNPKTSALTVYSVVRAIRNASNAIVV